MAKVKVTGVEQARRAARRKLKTEINKTLRTKDLRQQIGTIVVEDIRDNFNKSPAPATKKIREYFEKYNTTHPKYSRNNINFTFTGELLEDLRKNVKADTTKGTYTIKHSDKQHKKYKTAKGKVKKSVSHSKIFDHITSLGSSYNYLKLNDRMLDNIVKVIQDSLLRLIRKNPRI